MAAILTSILGVTAGAAALVVGCGGDDTIIGTGGGPDSGGDTFTPDVITDTGVVDTGSDVVIPFDAGTPAAEIFAHQINQVGCNWLQTCCGGPSKLQVDGPGGCVDFFDNDPTAFGYQYTRGVEDHVDGGGDVTFDATKANQCIALIQAMSCTTPLTSAQALAIRDACYGAIKGNVGAGGSCQDSIECATPAHCDKSVDGGTCVAPLATGATCNSGALTPKEEMNNCGRGYTGQPGNCELGGVVSLATSNQCAGPLATGSACLNPFECSSYICDTPPDGGFDLTCLDNATFTNADLNCGFAFLPDAGDGG